VKPHKESGKAGLINRIFFFDIGTFLSNLARHPLTFSRPVFPMPRQSTMGSCHLTHPWGKSHQEGTESQAWPSMPVVGHVSLQTSRRNAGMRQSVSCLRSFLFGTGSVAISAQASEGTLPRLASMAAPLSLGQPGARGSLLSGARPTGFPVPLVCRCYRN